MIVMGEPFNKYFICNFHDGAKPTSDLPNERLRQLWQYVELSKERLDGIISEWEKKKCLPQLSKKMAESLLCDAIEIFLLFLQYNFTGPFTKLDELRDFLIKNPIIKCHSTSEHLTVNGEEVNPNVRLGALLAIVWEILEFLLNTWPESLFLRWWLLRLICVHQQLIDELTSDLFDKLESTSNFLLDHIKSIDDKELEALLYTEIANGYLLFHRCQQSRKILEDACKHLNIVMNVEGLLGLRTKFQQKPLPQLCLKVEQLEESNLPTSAQTHGQTQIPKLLMLGDDTRLERIRFIEPKDNEVMSLSSILQVLVLSKVKLLKRSQPKDRLIDEELEPYIQTLLYQEFGPLQVRLSALLLNCIQECNQRRTVERSWKQCEQVVHLLHDFQYTVPQRISYGFASFLQPVWKVQMQLCQLLISLGMTKTALDIYLKIQAWEGVIDCYTRLEMRQRAAEVIKQELEKKPTILLYCMLGDATDDVSCYETAWNISKHTSAKAKAHWGTYYFQRREFELALPHLEKSVEINPLQEKIWLRLGYAAIILERWQLAVHAYITYTHLEPLGFESWNNLAKALIKLGDKTRAHKLLGESLKCNYTNWKVWENFMVVSMDTGNFEDAINAYNRLSELKERFLDLEILSILTDAIAHDRPDSKGQPAGHLLKKGTILLSHQCMKHGNEPRVWELAAQLAPTALKKAEKLVKAYRFHTVKENGWTLKQTTSHKALQLCHDLCRYSLEAVNNTAEDESQAMVTSQLHSARLSTQGCISAVEKVTDTWPENEELLSKLKKLHEEIQEQVKK